MGNSLSFISREQGSIHRELARWCQWDTWLSQSGKKGRQTQRREPQQQVGSRKYVLLQEDKSADEGQVKEEAAGTGKTLLRRKKAGGWPRILEPQRECFKDLGKARCLPGNTWILQEWGM